MYQMTKRFILPLLLLALALPTFAQRGAARDGVGMKKGMMIQALELTAEQETQMQDLRYENEKVLINLRADLKSAQLDLRKLKRADEPNKKKIYAQIDEVSDQRTTIQKAKVDHHLEIRKILTDEQFDIFRKNMQKRDGRRGQRGDRGKGDRGCRGFRR